MSAFICFFVRLSAVSVLSLKPVKHSLQLTFCSSISYPVDIFLIVQFKFLCLLLLPRERLRSIVMSILIFTIFLPAALRAAQTCRYFVYSEADFEVFRPAGVTRCTDGGEIWHGGGDRRSPPPCQISPHRCNDKGVGPPKLKFLLTFDQNVEYKRPAGAYPLRDFHKICRVCTSFQDALGVKTWLDLLKGLWSYGGFKLRGSGFPQIFSAP